MTEREMATGLLALKIETALARELHANGECHSGKTEDIFEAYRPLFGLLSILEPGRIKPARLAIPGDNA